MTLANHLQHRPFVRGVLLSLISYSMLLSLSNHLRQPLSSLIPPTAPRLPLLLHLLLIAILHSPTSLLLRRGRLSPRLVTDAE